VRLSLRHKLVGGFGLLLVLIVLLVWVTLSLFNSLRTVQSRVINEAIPGLVTVNEVVRSYTAQTSAVRGYLINSQPRVLQQYRSAVSASNYWEDQGKELFESGDERRLLERLISAGASYHELVDERVIPLAQQGRRSLAFSLLGEEGRALTAEIETYGERLRTLQNEVVADSEDSLQRRNTQVLVTLVVVSVAALAIGVALAVILPRRLAANISRLVEAARAIGRGDFDQRPEVHSGDEIEELAVRFGEMQAGLKRLQQLFAQDRELEIAASIQQSMLQRTLPEIPGVRIVPILRQANLVGGDWYDVDVSARQISVVVGDASGKGIGAALIATVTLSVLRAERRLGATTKRIIEQANQALREGTDSDSFTTCVYTTLDPATGEIRWLNMGHPAPFLLRGEVHDDEGRGYYLEGPRNRALGWFEDPGLAEAVAHLAPGDRLVFYTDGFIEAKSAEGEMFGEERFAGELLRGAPLGSRDLGEEAIRGVERFAAGKLDDDLTMLILEFVGSSLEEGASQHLTGVIRGTAEGRD
jgi:serine phosphatase RsbU (regulator of sigma subunit)/CHASE3 domain sensor protein